MEWYERAKRILTERNLERSALQDAIDVEESTLRSYLNGTRTPSIHKLTAIADFLHVSLDELMGRTQYHPLPVQHPEHRVNEDGMDYAVIRRYSLLREHFDSLTEQQQEDVLRELSATKQKNEDLLKQLLARKKSA